MCGRYGKGASYYMIMAQTLRDVMEFCKVCIILLNKRKRSITTRILTRQARGFGPACFIDGRLLNAYAKTNHAGIRWDTGVIQLLERFPRYPFGYRGDRL